jgi:septum formation inhibitor MinC
MSKIAIISQPEQGVLIDVGGCATLQEATQHLTCTLQVSSHFWEDQPVDLNLGTLSLSRDELGQVLSTLSEVGVKPRHVFARSAGTKAALRAFNILPASGQPATLPGAETAAEAATTGDEEDASPVAVAAAAAAAVTASERMAAGSASTPCCSAGDRDTVPVAKPAKKQAAPAEAPVTTGGDAGVSVSVADAAGVDLPQEPAEPATGETDNAEDAPLTFEPGDEAEDSVTVTEAEAPPAPKEPAKPAAPYIMYLRQTLRSGQSISHKGHLVIIGDVNAGAEVIAEGDITIWGALRGIAHAGVDGNTNAEIRALRFDPIQLRIAHAIARSPDRPKSDKRSNGPETARIINGTIRIAVSMPD